MSHLEKDEQKMRFIHGLYQRLIVPSSTDKPLAKHAKTKPYEKFKWDDLSELVLEQTVTLTAQLSQLREAVSGFVWVLCGAPITTINLPHWHVAHLSAIGHVLNWTILIGGLVLVTRLVCSFWRIAMHGTSYNIYPGILNRVYCLLVLTYATGEYTSSWKLM